MASAETGRGADLDLLAFLGNLEMNVYNEDFMVEHFGVHAWPVNAREPVQTSCTTSAGEPLTLRAVQDLLAAKLPSYKAEEYKPNANPILIAAAKKVIVSRVERALSGGQQEIRNGEQKALAEEGVPDAATNSDTEKTRKVAAPGAGQIQQRQQTQQQPRGAQPRRRPVSPELPRRPVSPPPTELAQSRR